MTRRRIAVLTCLGAALIGAAASLAGVRGAAVVLAGALAVECLTLLARRYSGPRASPVPPARRPELPTPPGATTQRELSAIQMATRGPRWADTALRPQLTRIVDSLGGWVDTTPARRESAAADERLGAQLSWFLDPERQIRRHDEGRALSLNDIEDMIDRIEMLT